MAHHASLSSIIGTAGEYATAAELLLRGWIPLISAVDGGVDIHVQGGPTLQVKTCETATTHKGSSGNAYYVFTFHHAIRETSKGKRKAIKREQRLVAEFVVLWAAEPRRFWIVPASVVGKRHTVSIPTARRGGESQWEKWRDRWDLLAPVPD